MTAAAPGRLAILSRDSGLIEDLRRKGQGAGIEVRPVSSPEELEGEAFALLDGQDLDAGHAERVAEIRSRQPGAVHLLAAAEDSLERSVALFRDRVDAFVRKPLLLPEILQAVRQAGERHALHAALRRQEAEAESLCARLRNLSGFLLGMVGHPAYDQPDGRLLQASIRAANATGGSLFLCEDQGLRLVTSLGGPHAPDFIPFPLPEESALRRSLAERRAVLRDPSALILPFVRPDGAACGLVILYSRRSAFGRMDVELGQAVSSMGCEFLAARAAAGRLLGSETLYRAVFENAGVAVAVVEEDMTIGMANAEFERLTGCSREEGYALRSFLDCLVPEDRPRVREPDPGPGGRSFILLGRGGGRRPVLGRCSRIPGADKTVICLQPQGQTFGSALIDASPAFIVTLDPQGRIRRMNEAMLQALGYRAEQVIGRDYAPTLVPLEERERVNGLRSELARPGAVIRIEHSMLTRDGGRIPVEWQGRALHRPGGELDCILGVGFDTTRRRSLENALRDSVGTFQAIAEKSCSGMLILDEVGRILYSNRQLTRLLGLPEADLSGRKGLDPFRQVLDRRSYHFLLRCCHRRRHGQPEPERCLFRARFQDGRKRWLAIRVSTFDLPMERHRTVLQMLDRTAQVEARKGLHLSVCKYRSLFDDAPIGIASFDREGRVREINSTLRRILDLPPGSNIQGMPIGELPGLASSGFAAGLQRCLETGAAGDFEGVFQPAGGARKDLRCHLKPLKNGGQQTLQVQAIVEDVTERKKIEAQLAQVQKMEAVGTLAGGIAHEFNNLLQIIQGYAELLLLEPKEDSWGQAEIQEIRIASRRAADLTSQLLVFSQETENRFDAVNLNQEAVQAIQLLQKNTPGPIEIDLHLSERLPPIRADALQLKRLITNLALNARDALPQGGRIVIRTELAQLGESFCAEHPGLEPGPHVLLSVTDNGRGMDPHTLSHIYEPFFTTKATGQGTGLGLAMVYGIVRSHRGWIDCQSSPGEGTTFRVYLPVEQPKPPVHPAHGGAPPPPARRQPAGGMETILLVDDEEMLRKLAVKVLGKSGYRVLTSADGETAMDMYRRYREEIRLVILDLLMPGRGGAWCLEELKKLDPGVKVLVSSGFSSQTTISRIMAGGACGFIRKPFRFQELLHQIRQVLDRGG
jgi:PAS domain S-box-containing protein